MSRRKNSVIREQKAAVDGLAERARALSRESPDQALTLAGEAYRLAEAGGFWSGMAEAAAISGSTLAYLTRTEEALATLSKALILCAEHDCGIAEAEVLNSAGAVYRAVGQYESAIDSHSKALEASRRLQSAEEEAESLNGLGLITADLGRHKEALNYYLAAYALADKIGREDFGASLETNIGRSFMASGNVSVAIEYFEESLAQAERLNDHILRAQALTALGEVQQQLGDFERALEYHQLSLEACEFAKNDNGKTQALINLGKLSHLEGHFRESVTYCSMAYEIARQGASRRSMYLALSCRAEAFEALGDFKSAYLDLRSSLEISRIFSGEELERRIRALRMQHQVERSRRETELERQKNLELSRKKEELELANGQLLVISNIGTQIAASQNLGELVETIRRNLAGMMSVDKTGLALYSEDSGEIRFMMFYEGAELHAPFSSHVRSPLSVAALAIREREPVIVGSREELLARMPARGGALLAADDPESMVFMPLKVEERVVGVFTVQSAARAAYDEGKCKLLLSLAPYISIAVENSMMLDQLNEMNRIILGEKLELEKASKRIAYMANHDNLTDLPNRRLLFELLQHSFGMADRLSRKVALMYIDLDDFKPINDRFGHAAGDKALVEIAGRIKLLLRSSDGVARVGGDEFVVFLTNVRTRADVQRVAVKLIEICTEVMEIRGDEVRIGMSMGISIYPSDGRTIEDLLNKADEAMYRVKQRNKNGFEFYCPKEEVRGPSRAGRT